MSVLVIDVGSSSTRAILFDNDARKIPGAEVVLPHSFVISPPGASTIDMALLRANIEKCISEILTHPEAGRICVVGIDTFVGNILGVDANGLPVTPVFSYADTRCTPQMLSLSSQVDLYSTYQRTGCLLHTAYLPARFRWLQESQPQVFCSVDKWVDLATYLYWCWFGDHSIPTTYSVAAWNGLLDRFSCDWDTTWLKILNIPIERLPTLNDYDSCVMFLSDDYSRRWRILSEIPFCLCLGDGAAANVGSGCIDRRHVALTVGTTAAVRVADHIVPESLPIGLWGYRITKDIHLLGGATSEGGNTFHWLSQMLGTKLSDSVLLNHEPDSHGLTFLPLLNGERSPGWHANAVGTIHGIRLSTSVEQIIQATFESVALRLAAIFERISQFASNDAQIIAGGGAINSYPNWVQTIANACNHSISITDETELTARGTAILALKAVGIETEIQPRISQTFYPKPDHAKRLREARQRQDELYSRIYQQEGHYHAS